MHHRWRVLWGDVMGNLTVKESGEMASFISPNVNNITSFKVHFNPRQEGSGDPSLDNVREITGWNGVEGYISNVAQSYSSTSNTLTTSTDWTEDAGTVYGGYVDLVSGELVKELDIKVFDGTENIQKGSWASNTDSQFYITEYTLNNGLPFISDSNGESTFCNILTSTSSSYFKKGNVISSVGSNSTDSPTHKYIVWESSMFGTTIEECKSKLAELYNNGTPLTFVGKIADSFKTTYQLTPQQLSTLKGQNNFWSNADYIEIEYELTETFDIQKAKRKIILNQPHVESASDDIVTFDTDMRGKLKECKVYFSPVQEGEGDPSPDNVRNIVGWNGVSVTHTNEDGIQNSYSVDWTDSAGTVYGGYVDLVSGELVQTHYLAEITTTGLTSQNTNFDTTEDSIYFVIKNSFPQMLSNDSNGKDRTYSSEVGILPVDCKVNYLKPDYIDNWRGTTNVNTIVRTYVPPNFAVRMARDLIGVTSEDSETIKAQKINNYLTEHPLQVYYKLETPIHYQLTPQQLTALRGTNNIYSNTNGQTEIKYWKH